MPYHAGIAAAGGRPVARADQEIADVVISADRAIPVEQGLDPAAQQAGRGALAQDRLIDQL
jgi:hypothetical protein